MGPLSPRNSTTLFCLHIYIVYEFSPLPHYDPGSVDHITTIEELDTIDYRCADKKKFGELRSDIGAI
jgi:hypothetical protein